MSSTTPLPAPTDSTPDERPGIPGIVLIIGGLLLISALFYGVVTDIFYIRYGAWMAASAAVGIDLFFAFRRMFRFSKKRPIRDAEMIAEPLYSADERQRQLSLKARAAAGLAPFVLAVSLFFLAPLSWLWGVRIHDVDDWMALAFALAYGIMIPYMITLKLAARHLSRKA